MSRGWKFVAAGVVLVVLLAVGGWRWRGHRQAEAACAPNQANADAAPDRGGSAGGTPAFILGDSWASGWGLDDPTDSFAYVLADGESWDARVNAFPGSGYVAASQCGGQAFGSRVQDIPVDTKVVVVEGGINDARAAAPDDDVRISASATLGVIEQRVPDAQIFVVGPPEVPSLSTTEADRVDRILNDVATDAGVTYVSTIDWSIDTQKDGLHPTVKGHAYLAAQLQAVIAAG